MLLHENMTNPPPMRMKLRQQGQKSLWELLLYATFFFFIFTNLRLNIKPSNSYKDPQELKTICNQMPCKSNFYILFSFFSFMSANRCVYKSGNRKQNPTSGQRNEIDTAIYIYIYIPCNHIKRKTQNKASVMHNSE